MDSKDIAGSMMDKAVARMVKAGIPRHLIPVALTDAALMISVVTSGSGGAEALIAQMSDQLRAIERGELGREYQEAARANGRVKMRLIST